MIIKNSWPREILFLMLDVAIIVLFVLWAIGVRVNLTPSVPRGLYLVSYDAPAKGDLVGFCLDKNNPFSELAQERSYLGPGSCPSGLRPLVKKLSGLPGDRVELEPDGIVLNGQLLAGTEKQGTDRVGRMIPNTLLKPGLIPPDQALVLSSDHPGSFDGRHFGLVPFDSLTKIRPLLVESK
ncbi:conjugative transfer signal peptidase TraF [Deltaproteobacteria bacterium OttesenSCG-928-M10]|nr:conjugative transfer signal peptidase TraF [Deltaproteobacteria bacterium OttesenSCG-928-M10]